ncbi:NtaA/DmoA family FMN-dependent monooxygenase [Kribbia dieselivorans]|uniref:NtaA/DmoA family FMN-dependent monooxygenase n=1 Tax=Kribbia dieselivorans TaxID=331526 RepID=UPI0008383726|nr:NtaA/DmoA family FMN-dependent monooxygenase [Kribbia dieselivorans]
MSTQLILNAFVDGVGHHEAAWRLPQSAPGAALDVAHYRNLARIAERGRFDSLVFQDSPAQTHSPAHQPSPDVDPVILLAALAAATEHIGLIATASTTYSEPFGLARSFASLDHASRGRAGWNAVTSAAPNAAHNFGLAELPSHADRDDRADEFIDVVQALWNSWDPSAVRDDRAGGVYADPLLVRPIAHEGRHFRVEGPLTLPRSAQGHPVIVQAGSSPAGVALAARHAEAVFTAQRTLTEAQEFYATLKAATAAAGRNPKHIKVLPGVVPYIGSTQREARDLERQFDDLLAPGERSAHGHRTIAGTPAQIADDLQTWFEQGAADGFTIMAPALPSGLEVFVDQVVPILQERGLFRTEYTATTLRGHLGLPVPEPRSASAFATSGP